MKPFWQDSFSRMTYGIYVLTTRHETVINGMIASWVSQVSHDPPLIMVAVHPSRFSHELMEKSGCFALHVISRSQKDLLNRFKGPEPLKKFTGITWQAGKTGCPVLNDCLAWFECAIRERYQPGNHSLFVGEVFRAGFAGEAVPLCTLDYEGVYTGRR
jgi:flavin reductase (DIM6/NTAB) family NADH-FMN oxidoreductase RutF